MADEKDTTVIDNQTSDDQLQSDTSNESTPEVLAKEVNQSDFDEAGTNGAQVSVEGETGTHEYSGEEAFKSTHEAPTINGVMRGFSGF